MDAYRCSTCVLRCACRCQRFLNCPESIRTLSILPLGTKRDFRKHAGERARTPYRPVLHSAEVVRVSPVHCCLSRCKGYTSARASSSVPASEILVVNELSKACCVVSQERKATKSKIVEQVDSIDLKPPKGTRDFYPDDMRLRKWMFGEFAAVSELFGFEQYDSPVLESEALFVRKAGEEIRDQLFNFKDKGDRAVALRPELTPSLSRMFLAKAGTMPQPVKWYGIGQCWRYERMTRGRRREHYQWNMDIIGVAEVTAEAELLSAITTFFKVLPTQLQL